MPQSESLVAVSGPRDAFAAYLTYLEAADAHSYEGGTELNFVVWRALQILALAGALGGSVASALSGRDGWKESTLVWSLSVVLPLISGALTAAISQTKVAELYLNRRKNFAKVQFLVDNGWARFHAAAGDNEYTAAHRSVAAEMEKVRGSWAE